MPSGFGYWFPVRCRLRSASARAASRLCARAASRLFACCCFSLAACDGEAEVLEAAALGREGVAEDDGATSEEPLGPGAEGSVFGVNVVPVGRARSNTAVLRAG